jgi:hypothetical protein
MSDEKGVGSKKNKISGGIHAGRLYPAGVRFPFTRRGLGMEEVHRGKVFVPRIEEETNTVPRTPKW